MCICMGWVKSSGNTAVKCTEWFQSDHLHTLWLGDHVEDVCCQFHGFKAVENMSTSLIVGISWHNDLQQHTWIRIKVAHGCSARDCWCGLQEACDNALPCQTVECWLKDDWNCGWTNGAIQAHHVQRNSPGTQQNQSDADGCLHQ